MKVANKTEGSALSSVPLSQHHALQSQLNFWSAVNNHVISTRSFQRLELFENVSQSFCLKIEESLSGPPSLEPYLEGSARA